MEHFEFYLHLLYPTRMMVATLHRIYSLFPAHTYTSYICHKCIEYIHLLPSPDAKFFFSLLPPTPYSLSVFVLFDVCAERHWITTQRWNENAFFATTHRILCIQWGFSFPCFFFTSQLPFYSFVIVIYSKYFHPRMFLVANVFVAVQSVCG